MNVRDVMTKDAKSCKAIDPLSVAARIMWDHDCGCVPVVNDQNEVVGMLTDRDICMAAYTRNLPLDEISVGSTMATEVFGIGPEDSIAAAEEIMRQHQVRRLPVLGFERQLVGLLSLNDLARMVSDGKRSHTAGLSPLAVEQTLAAVGKPREASHVAPHIESAA